MSPYPFSLVMFPDLNHAIGRYGVFFMKFHLYAVELYDCTFWKVSKTTIDLDVLSTSGGIFSSGLRSTTMVHAGPDCPSLVMGRLRGIIRPICSPQVTWRKAACTGLRPLMNLSKAVSYSVCPWVLFLAVMFLYSQLARKLSKNYFLKSSVIGYKVYILIVITICYMTILMLLLT